MGFYDPNPYEVVSLLVPQKYQQIQLIIGQCVEVIPVEEIVSIAGSMAV
jgi:hypothetical protein